MAASERLEDPVLANVAAVRTTGAAGVTAVVATEAGLGPAEFEAVTVKV